MDLPKYARRSAVHRFRIAALGFVAVASLPLSVAVAYADCKDDIGKLMDRRMAEVTQIQKISKAHGGKLDPIAACPRLKSLVSIEAEASAYFSKNQDWCNLPPDYADKMAAARTRDAGFAEKACSFAVKMKQMQQQQAQQQQQQQQEAAPKLPAGPL